MCELVQYLGELLTRHDLVGAVLRQLLKRGADLMADGGVRRHVVGKLVQGRRDLLLLLAATCWAGRVAGRNPAGRNPAGRNPAGRSPAGRRSCLPD